jgi:hypothetical protein
VTIAPRCAQDGGILVQTLVPPVEPLFGSYDAVQTGSVGSLVAALNQIIAAWAALELPMQLTDTGEFERRIPVRRLTRWPEHASYLSKSRKNRSETVLDVSNTVAEVVPKLPQADPGGIDKAVDDYRFLCEENVLPEELFFRSNGRYRLSKFAEANTEVYENGPFMDRYMNGLLFSNVIWHSHGHAMTYYVTQYLPRLPMGADTLEIGPGHGIFMYFAAITPNVGSVTGWDLSAASVAKT